MSDRVSEQREAQKALWNGPSGAAWVAEQALLDRLLRPFEERLVAAVAGTRAKRVLDIGCGTGATSLAIARTLPPDGHCTGVDISAPMLALARERAAAAGLPVDFILGDAQEAALPTASFDLAVSRFGIMFFADPVAAFANIRRSLRPDGRLGAIAWRSAADNPFMTTAERAAAPFLPDLPPRDPEAPGQFAFGDAARVRRILEESGWSGIAIEPLDAECRMSRADLESYYSRLGPVGGALAGADAETRRQVLERLAEAFAPFVMDGEVRFTAACWWIAARPA